MATSRRDKAIHLLIESEAAYQRIVASPRKFRRHIEFVAQAYPETLPPEIVYGFRFHQIYHSKKQSLRLRSIRLKANGQVYLLRPCFVMPYLTARTSELDKPLYLARFGVPPHALAYVFGRTASFYERAFVSLGRISLVGATIKDPDFLPQDLTADEKHTRLCGERVYLPTTVAEGCILGASVTTTASEADLKDAYAEFLAEAREVAPEYAPRTVCLDGWKHSHRAWKALVPTITIILCYLHSVLTLLKRGKKKPYFSELLDHVWGAYEAVTKAEFSQRIRRLGEWAQRTLEPGDLLEAVLKLCSKRDRFKVAYEHEGCRRTSNAVDRLMDYQDRLLYRRRYFHGTRKRARLVARAQALLWNFHPYSERLVRQDAERRSPFVDVNGFEYHENWLENLVIAASMGGRRR